MILSFVIALLVSGCMSASPEENFKKGQTKLQQNDKKKAYKYFLKAVKLEPKNGRYQWAAAKASSNSNAAYIHAKKAWDAGLRNQEVLLGLMHTRIETQEEKNLQYGIQLFENLPDSLQTDVFRGELHFRFGDLDSSVHYWNQAFLDRPTDLVCRKLGAAYQKQGHMAKGIQILEKCLDKKALQETGYTMLANLYAGHQDNASVEILFEKIKELGQYGARMMLEYGSYLSSRGKFTEAEKILKPVSSLKDPSLKQLAHEAKIHLAYCSYMKHKEGALQELIETLQSQEGAGEDEANFYATLGKLAASKNAGSENPELKVTLQVHDVALSLAARELNRLGLPENSNLMLNKLRGFFTSSPDLWILKAYNLSNQSKEIEALKIIHTLHEKKIFTKNSLILLRDITYKKNMLDKSMAAQKLLEKHFPDDREVFLWSARFAISNGNYQKALLVLTQLSDKYPEDSQIMAERIELLYQLKRYQDVIEFAGLHQNLDERAILTLAKTHRKRGALDKAEEVYKKAVKEKASPLILLHYADFLVDQGKNNQANKMFERAINNNEAALRTNRKLFAIALNNYAWSLTQADKFDSKSGLEAIEKALSLYPDEPYLLDTYAVCLLKSKKPKRLIAFFEKHRKTSTEPQLLVHLARAYLERKNLNQASRTFQKALDQYDGEHVLTVKLSKGDINQEISRINNL